jgi:signal peptidase I
VFDLPGHHGLRHTGFPQQLDASAELPQRDPVEGGLLPNGQVIYEPPTFRETLPNGASFLIIDHYQQRLDNYDEITVPEGHVFLMGDNRDHSADSRAEAGPFSLGLDGPVPIHDIGGRAEFLTFSLDGSAGWNPLTWWKSLRPDRAWTTLRPELRGSGARDE